MLLAELHDADTTLTLSQVPMGYQVLAIQCDGVSLPITVHEKTYGNLGEAIKAIAIFYVGEWESVFLVNRLSERMESAITAR